MCRSLAWVLAGAMLLAFGAGADRIEVDGEVLEDVYVRETPRMVYVQIPEEGRVISVRRDRLDEGAIQTHPDMQYRERLRQQWQEAYDGRRDVPEDEREPDEHIDPGDDDDVIEIRRPEGEEPSAPKSDLPLLLMAGRREAAARAQTVTRSEPATEDRTVEPAEEQHHEQFQQNMEQLAYQQAMQELAHQQAMQELAWRQNPLMWPGRQSGIRIVPRSRSRGVYSTLNAVGHGMNYAQPFPLDQRVPAFWEFIRSGGAPVP